MFDNNNREDFVKRYKISKLYIKYLKSENDCHFFSIARDDFFHWKVKVKNDWTISKMVDLMKADSSQFKDLADGQDIKFYYNGTEVSKDEKFVNMIGE